MYIGRSALSRNLRLRDGLSDQISENRMDVMYMDQPTSEVKEQNHDMHCSLDITRTSTSTFTGTLSA